MVNALSLEAVAPPHSLSLTLTQCAIVRNARMGEGDGSRFLVLVPRSSPLPPPKEPLADPGADPEVIEPAVLLEGEIGGRQHPSPTSIGVGLMPFVLANRGVAGIGIAAEGVGAGTGAWGVARGGGGAKDIEGKRKEKRQKA